MRTTGSGIEGDVGGDQENSFMVGGLGSCNEPRFKAWLHHLPTMAYRVSD